MPGDEARRLGAAMLMKAACIFAGRHFAIVSSKREAGHCNARPFSLPSTASTGELYVIVS